MTERRTSASRSFLWYVAPALLCLVALTQRYLAFDHELNAWKGGGFGMFATINMASLRHPSVTLIRSGGREFRLPPRDLELRLPLGGRMVRLQQELLMLPTERRARRLARLLVDEDWVVIEGVPGDASTAVAMLAIDVPVGRTGAPLELEAIRVDIWQYRFKASESTLMLEHSTTQTVPREADAG
ncbi:MAG: hypothetical protein GY716_00680 [bacterium]|nr:hypothetical protein [bacterium]